MQDSLKAFAAALEAVMKIDQENRENNLFTPKKIFKLNGTMRYSSLISVLFCQIVPRF